MKISVKIIKNNDEIIANCPELDINCYGSNKDEAIRRIKSVIHFYIEAAKELGMDVENLHEIYIDGENNRSFLDDSIINSSSSIN